MTMNSKTVARPATAPVLTAAFAAIFALQSPLGAAVQINFGLGWLGADYTLSDGSPAPLDGSFALEVGVFAGGFSPTAENRDEWLAHWRPFTDAGGEASAQATAALVLQSTPFGSYPLANGSLQLEHNNAPLAEGTQAYLWGFDRRGGGGEGQWILIANPKHLVPQHDPAGGPAFTETWDSWIAQGVLAPTVVGELHSGGVRFESVPLSAEGGSGTPIIPLLAIADATASEKDECVVLTASLSEPAPNPVRVDCYAAAGSAAASVDFTAFGGSLTIPAGETSIQFEIELKDDDLAEADETFTVLLDSPSGAQLADRSASVTILDDDAPSMLTKPGSISIARTADGTGLALSWKAVAGRRYAVMVSEDLQHWHAAPGGEAIMASSSEGAFDLPEDMPHCFFQVLDRSSAAD